MKLALLLALLLYPVIELWVIFAVADWIGGLQTVLLLILSGMAGMAILRQERFTLRTRLRRGLSGGNAFLPELLKGAARLGAGFLLLLPGFLSDVVALALLLPGTRALLLVGMTRHIAPRFGLRGFTSSRSRGSPGDASCPAALRSGPAAPGVVDPAAVIIDVEYRDLGEPANKNSDHRDHRR